MKISGIADIIDKYDGFIIDLWGVIHDGTKLYPDSKNALEMLRTKGKKVVLLSNAPRRAFNAKQVLAELGVDESYYIDIVTSGECAYNGFKTFRLQQKLPMSKEFIYIGLEKDKDMIAEFGYNITDNAYQAGFIIATGFGGQFENMAQVMPVLENSIEFDLKLLCLNPDMYVVKQSGGRIDCAGLIAKHYREMGGEVIYFGKPYLEAYLICGKILGVPQEKTLCIGDSFETDIKGANRAGLDSLLIMGGIHKDSLLVENYAPALDELSKLHHAKPTYVATAFRG